MWENQVWVSQSKPKLIIEHFKSERLQSCQLSKLFNYEITK